jgi:hypothetical protein
MTCFLIAFRYGWTTGSPSGVVQMTEVISSLANLVLALAGVAFLLVEASISEASDTREGGMDRAISRAEVVNQSMMAFAPENRSPIQLNTC